MPLSWQCGHRRCCLRTGGLEAHSFQTSGTTLELGWRSLFEQDLIQICLYSTHAEPSCNFSSSSTERVPQTNKRWCNIICCLPFNTGKGGFLGFDTYILSLLEKKNNLSHILKFNICFFGSVSIPLDRVSEFLHMLPKRIVYQTWADGQVSAVFLWKHTPPQSGDAPVSGICTYSARVCCWVCFCSCRFYHKNTAVFM